jgi:glutamate dehydrogenase/leucine dehydrogenase
MKKIQELKSSRRSVTEYNDATLVNDDKEFLTSTCDVLVPAALENQLTKENADDLQASIILELANGPTTSEADHIIMEK